MFLTTEPSLFGKRYHALRVVYATKVYHEPLLLNNATVWNKAFEAALGILQDSAVNIGADGVIGVHHTASVSGERGQYFTVTVMGTAIKFY